MAIRFTYRIKKGRDVPRRLQRLNDALHDRTEVMRELKTYAVLRWRQNFESQGGIYGGWAALSPRSWRRGDNHGGTPLFLTGALFSNVMGQSNSGKVSSTAVVWHFRNGPPSYPLSHQFGWNPYFSQPSRIIWAFNGEDEAHAQRVMEAWVEEQVRRFF